jgi:catechol 2,3-dioxygenase-like lactoylglutathione lyase family enzyme
MSSWPGPISAITLVVDDLSTTRAFYRDVFRLASVYTDAVSAVFMFGDTMVNLLQASAARELVAPATVGEAHSDPRMVLTVTVDNVDATCALLAARGVELLNGPMDRPWGIRTASFRDPGGHVWEIAHPLPVP